MTKNKQPKTKEIKSKKQSKKEIIKINMDEIIIGTIINDSNNKPYGEISSIAGIFYYIKRYNRPDEDAVFQKSSMENNLKNKTFIINNKNDNSENKEEIN